MQETNLDHDWTVSCEALQRLHTPAGIIIGLEPRFRLRDQYKHSKHHEPLSAVSQNWAVHTTVLSKLQQISKSQLRKRRQKIQEKVRRSMSV